MAKLCEGSRVFTAAIDGAASHTDINDWQDQVKNMLGPLNVDWTGTGVPVNGSDWIFNYDPTPTPINFSWRAATPDSDRIVFYPKLRVGQKVTEISFGLLGTQNGGSVIWKRRPWDLGGAAPSTEETVQILATVASNSWATGGTNVTRYAVALTGTNGVIADLYTYYVEFLSSAGGGATPDWIYFVRAIEQFGN